MLRWWEEELQGASRLDVQRGLWLRGSLTVDPRQAELDFRRLVVEYPGGPYSGRALLRLAQSALATADSATAATHLRRLVREYPNDAGSRDAEEWMALVAPQLSQESPPDLPVAAAAVDAQPPAARDTTPLPRDPGSSAGTGTHSVQLGAFSSAERARALQRRATEAGLDARRVRVPGSELIRVRVGAFASPEEAAVALQRIQEMGFTVLVVRGVEAEEPVAR